MRAKGGQTLRVLEELRIIREKGWNPILAASPDGWLYQTAKKENFTTYALNFYGPLDFLSTFQIFKIIKKHSIDLIHCHSSKDGYPALYASKLAQIHCIRSKHIGLTKKPSVTYNFYDAIITTGSKIIMEMKENGIQNHFFSLPSFPDANRFFPNETLRKHFRKRYKIPEGKIAIGTLSGTNRRKRPHLLVEYAQNHPETIVLIAGPYYNNDYSKQLIKSIERFDNVFFLDFQTPEDFLNGIDIFACPSSNESTTQTIPQAMLCKKAVVAMDVGSISDLNINGNLPLCNSKNDFFNKLDQLVKDEKYRKNLAKLNYETARKYFHREILKENLIDLYVKVLEN